MSERSIEAEDFREIRLFFGIGGRRNRDFEQHSQRPDTGDLSKLSY